MKKNCDRFLLLAITLFVLGWASSLQAQILQVSNLANTLVGNYGVNSNTTIAQAFTTGATGNFTVTNVTMGLDLTAVDPNLTLSLYNNSSSIPGSLVTTFTADNPSATNPLPSTFTFSPSSSLTLAPSSTYWLVLSTTSSSPTGWSETSSPAYTSNLSGWSIDTANYADKFFSPSWTVFSGASSGGITFKFSVTTAVPEPSTWALLLIGGAGLFYFSRKRSAS